MSRLLVLTAFGAFGDVARNPTQEMIEDLQSTIVEWTFPDGRTEEEEKIPIIFQIIPVSVEDCKDSLLRIKESIATIERDRGEIKQIFMIHLGVDASARFMKLEQFGYNNMTFRIPDIRGYQPQGECINNLCSYNVGLETSFPIREAFQHFKEICPNLLNAAKIVSNTTSTEPINVTNSVFVNNLIVGSDEAPSTVFLSTDPGRYLCNYLYYQSLSYSTQQKDNRVKSLFIHVPPFSQIPKDFQQRILVGLINSLIAVSS